jgi:A/G-specific adenine glycosylase
MTSKASVILSQRRRRRISPIQTASPKERPNKIHRDLVHASPFLNTQNIRSFRRALLRWYSRNGRDLPWRRTRDPYAILVSEIMLQQTQVATVIPYYHEWLRRFPDFHALAAASETDVLHAWQGLGYYSRARNLHATAQKISRDHAGRCPATIEELRALPGIGRYTAHAILTFAYDQPVGIVEANTTRLLARMFNVVSPVDSTRGREILWNHAARVVPQNRSGEFNSALIDLGATICLPRAPRCGICPVKPFCKATNPFALPTRKPRPATKRLTERHVFAFQRGKLLLQRCQKRWRGMWMLPPLDSPANQPALHVSTFPFTHHRVTLKVFASSAQPGAPKEQRWFSVSALNSLPIPSPHRRAIEACARLKTQAV